MAVPKSKVSKQRRNKRRSSVWKLEDSRCQHLPQVRCCPPASPRLQELHDLQWS